MKPPERGALLSINASAARTFFDQETIKGLRIRTVGEVVQLKGVLTTGGADVVPVEQRGRGGLAAMVSVAGTNSPEFFRLLRRSGFRDTAPFFLLTELPRDWVGIKHWKKPNAPLNQPYLRVWMGESTTGRARKVAAAPVEEEETIDWRRLRRVLSGARVLMGRRGRVPRDLQMSREQARRNIEQFERLVETVLPERGNPEALQVRLERAVELRQVAEGQRDAAHEEREAVMEELAKLQRVLDQERRERRDGRAPHTVEEPEPPPRQQRVGGRRRRPFVVHMEPEDRVDPTNQEHVQNEPVTNEPEPDGPEMVSVTETERLANELEELELGEADVVVTEGTVTAVHTETDEPETGTDEGVASDEPSVLPDAEQPPTGEIEFPDEGEDEDEHH